MVAGCVAHNRARWLQGLSGEKCNGKFIHTFFVYSYYDRCGYISFDHISIFIKRGIYDSYIHCLQFCIPQGNDSL
jgi:hypothetical protein